MSIQVYVQVVMNYANSSFYLRSCAGAGTLLFSVLAHFAPWVVAHITL